MLNGILERFKTFPRGVKASFAFFFAKMVTSGISYFVTPIYTRILPPEVYGQTTIFMTWLHVLGIVFMFCLSYGVFNNGMIDYPEKRDEFSFSLLVLSNIITVVFSLITLGLYPVIKDYLGVDLPLLVLMFAVFFFQPAYSFWLTRQRYELKYKAPVIFAIVSAIASPLIAITCILLFNDKKLYARLFGAELTLIAMYIPFYIYLAKKSKFRISVSYWKPVLLFNLPLIPHYLSAFLLSNSNKILISNIVGDAELAYYSVAHAVAMVITTVWTSVDASLVPYTYEKCKAKEYSKISRVTMPILTAFAAVCVVLIMFAPEVVAIMATPDYVEAIYVIPPMVGGLFFQVHYHMYSNVVYYYKKPMYIMLASTITVVVNIVLGYFLISKFGYLAAGYSTFICYFLQATLDYFALKRVVKEKIYNMRYIGVLSGAVIVVSVLCNFVYNFVWLRYGIVLFLLGMCFAFRKRIIAAFKEVKSK